MSYIGSTPTTQSFIAGTDYFNGNGSTVNFTLSRSVNSVNDIEVIVNNVEQIPSGYSVSGTTLTFSAAPSAGTSNVYVRYLSTTNLSLAIPSGTSATFNTVTVADGSATTPSITNDGDTNTGIFFPAADTIAFAEGGVEAARFDSAGNLLVGTSTTGSAGINLSLTYNIGWGQGAGESIPNIFRQSSSAATVLTNGYRYSATANGFASSYSSSWAKSAIALNDGSVRFYTDTAVTTAAGTDVTPTERARINSSGSTFFNCTASPTSNASGPGGLNALISSGDVFNIKHTADGNNVFNIWQTGTASFNAITFFKGGSQTGIGQILGTTSSTAYQTSSDYRLKENITPMTGALDKVAQLKPVTYKWKVDGSDGQGFIAHELQAVVPDCVSGEKDQVNKDGSIKPQGIDTSFLVATLTAAIQEQQALITALTTRITALENNNATQ